jgi:hypothetical protein
MPWQHAGAAVEVNLGEVGRQAVADAAAGDGCLEEFAVNDFVVVEVVQNLLLGAGSAQTRVVSARAQTGVEAGFELLQGISVVKYACVARADVDEVVRGNGVAVFRATGQHKGRGAGRSASVHEEGTTLDGRVQRLSERGIVGATGLKIIGHGVK